MDMNADPIVTPGADAPTTTLQPQEYLLWLLSLERASGLPEGTRAYLVVVGRDGSRTLTPVANGSSVLNIEGELIKHLRAKPFTTSFFRALRDECDKQLGGESAVPPERTAIARRASWEIDQLATLLEREVLENTEGAKRLPLASMLRRIQRLASTQMSALDDEMVGIEEMEEELSHG
jgi:hypothetical protein